MTTSTRTTRIARGSQRGLGIRFLELSRRMSPAQHCSSVPLRAHDPWWRRVNAGLSSLSEVSNERSSAYLQRSHPFGRFREFRGSCGSRVELQSTEVEVDRGLEMLAVAVAAGRYPDGLDAGVQAFGAGVGDRVGEVGQQSRLVTLQCLGGVDDRFQPGVGGPEVPAFEVLGAPAAALVGPEVTQALLDRPRPAGLQVGGAEDGEAVPL